MDKKKFNGQEYIVMDKKEFFIEQEEFYFDDWE